MANWYTMNSFCSNLICRDFVRRTSKVGTVFPRLPRSSITAHGVNDHRRQWLLAAKKHLIDTTCPLVGRVHEAAQQLHQAGFHVLVLGKAGHVEVQGIVEDLPNYSVVCAGSMRYGHFPMQGSESSARPHCLLTWPMS